MTSRRQVRERRRRRSRRIRALLAGGLVFGVGAAATLASWTDVEQATATFTSGSFGIEGSVDGVTYVDHTVSGTPAPLNFQLAPTAMVPGTTTYALFAVRTLSDSVAGTVALAADAPTGGLATSLTYGVRVVAGPSCTASDYAAASGATVVPDGSALSAPGSAPQVVGAGGADPVYYCFAVTLPTEADNAAQGQSAQQNWTFTGVNS